MTPKILLVEDSRYLRTIRRISRYPTDRQDDFGVGTVGIDLAEELKLFLKQDGAVQPLRLDAGHRFLDRLMCLRLGFVQAHSEFDALTSRHTVVETAVRFQLFPQIDRQLRPYKRSTWA
jgi:hypothetical protein